MKIAYILSDTTMIGGASKSFLSMMSELQARGIEPIVVVPDRNGFYAVLKKKGIKTIVVPVRFSTYPRLRSLKEWIQFPLRLLVWQYYNFISVKRLVKLFSADKPDIIHTNVSVVDIGFKTSKRLGIPHVYHIREYADKDFNLHYFPSKNSFRKSLLCEKSYTISITHDIQQYHGLRNDARNCVIYNGIISSNSRLPIGRTGNYFLYAGRIEKTKGLLELVEAYSRYSLTMENALPLLVAGEILEMNYYKAVVALVKANILTDNVRFLGRVDDMKKLYKNARALIIPSFFEGFGRCMAEAMSFGCPVIGHNTGGTKEQFDNGMNLTSMEIGFRYNSKDELFCMLKTLHEMPDMDLQKIRLRAWNVVKELYSVKANADSVEALYKYIMHEKDN